jgi:hypothetical protein
MTAQLHQILIERLKELFLPLLGSSEEEALPDLLDALNWDGTALGITDPAPFTAFSQKIFDAIDALDTLSEKDSIGIVELAASLAPLAEAVVDVKNLISSMPPPPGSSADTLTILGNDVLDFLIDYYVESRYPRLSLILQCTGIFSVVEIPEIKNTNGTVLRAPTQRRHLNIDALSQAVRDPLGYLRQTYLLDGAGGRRLADAIADLIGPELAFRLREIGLTAGYGYLNEDLTPDEVESARRMLVVDAPTPSGADHATILLRLILALSDEPSGLGVMVALNNNISVNIQTPAGNLTGELSGGLEPVLITKDSVAFASPDIGGAVQFKASAGFHTDPADVPCLRFGSADGTRFEIGQVRAGGSLGSDAQGVDAAGSLDLEGIVLAIQGSDGDGFIGSILPDRPIEMRVDLGIDLSLRKGVRFRGSGGLEIVLPVHIGVGPLEIQGATIKASPETGKVHLTIGATVKGSLGPVTAVIENMGLQAELHASPSGGNLGSLQLDIGFKPPSGVGLAVDAAGLTGGGFLKHDEAAAQYAGMLQLTYQQFQLQAFGLIATRLPTGPGYSLVAMIDANFPPIELVAGFTLNGVGGLLGIHRTVSTDALQAALKAHTLSNFLFAKNPVANAPQLLTDLAAFFPPAAGRYVFGPLLQIGWGTPTVITIDLALILELPDPVRLVLIGELVVLLPEPDEVLLELHMDVLGTINFGTDEGSLDAALHDSRLTRFPLHGAMALRGCWAGHDKTFLLAVGGFHPAFQPPPGFPTLDRVSISMPSGHIAKLNLNGYLAVTSNTLQIGAHLDVFVGVDGFGISGFLNFDTLIERRPFHFEADISGGVTLSVDGHDVMSLHLDANMSGPTPWHVAGGVHFSVLGFGVTKHFSAEFGDPATAQPLVQVDVGQLLRTALGDPRNFAASLTTNENGLVSLRTPLASGVVLAHPSASLKIQQRVAPLGLSITRFGASAPLGDTLFNITAVGIDGIVRDSTPLFDDFSPAQFLDLSHDEELSSPSFETFPAGVSLGEHAVTFGRATPPTAAMTRGIAFETWFVDTLESPPREDTGVTAPPKRLTAILTALADSGQRRYAAPSQPVVRGPLDYVVATTDQLVLSGVGAATGQTYAQARAAMEAAIAQNPNQRGTLQVVARYEVP